MTKFDPNQFYQFDFSQGTIQAPEGKRVFVLPEEIFLSILTQLPQTQALEALSQMGQTLGKQFRESEQELDQLSVESAIQKLNTFLALFGLGTANFERWGDALVFQLENLPGEQEHKKALRHVIESFLGTVFDEPIRCIPVDAKRVLIAHEKVAPQIRNWTHQGFSFGQILDRLESDVQSNSQSDLQGGE